MNIEELIHDLRARINPQYYDQLGTESYERHQVVKALEYLQQENERQRFDILAMNQSLDLLREENGRLRKDAERYLALRKHGVLMGLPFKMRLVSDDELDAAADRLLEGRE
jgi:hypothetical protein